MRTTIFSLLVAAALMLSVGCETANYYDGTAPEVVRISPDRERSLTGCQHVVVEVDDLEQCETPSVVIGSRNATVLPSEGVQSGEDLDYWMERCFLDEIDIDDGAINVIAPPGPVAGGTVDVQVACADGIGTLEDGYEYADGRHTREDTDLHENEVSGIAVFWQDGPFVNVPFVYGYGFVHEQPVPRQSIFLSGDHDAVATRDGVKPQTPAAVYDLPEGADRLRIGDSIDFYYPRDLPLDPAAQYVGSPTNFQNENVLFLAVHYQRPDGEACYAGATDEDGGYYWGSGSNTDTASKGCVRFYKVHHNLLQGQNAAEEDIDGYTLPLDFTWQGVMMDPDLPKYETRYHDDGTAPDPSEVGIELPTGTYYSYLTRSWESFGLPMDPHDPLDVPLEYFPNLHLDNGATEVTLTKEAALSLYFDQDVRYYINTDTVGENCMPANRELFVRASGGSSYGSQVEAFDTDLNGNGEYDAGEYVISVPPSEDEASATSGFPAALGLYDSFPMYLDREPFYDDMGNPIVMDDGDWDSFEDDGINAACTGIPIFWTSDCTGEDAFAGRDSCFDGEDNDGDELTDMDDPHCFCANDFVTAIIEVWEWGLPTGLGYVSPYRIVARAWDTDERLCFPPQALAALPDITANDLEPSDQAPERYAHSGFGSFSINKHRLQKVPIDELYGNMIVDLNHTYGAYFITVNNCEDGIDNDGDGAIDEADPGCTGAIDDFWEREEGAECDDGIDNDGDGLIDLADEEDCDNSADPYEGTRSSCDDGYDNDGDGWVDFEEDDPFTEGIDESLWGDPGCESEDDNSEDNADLGECADGVDNDGDGLVDGYDPQCDDPAGQGYQSQHEGPQCNDGEDNDGDGLIDLDDPECEDLDDNQEAPTGCEDGVDNDGDGWVDAEDPDCYYYENVTETGLTIASWACADGEDNDGDGLIDGHDPDCQDAEHETEEPPDPTCSDGDDNDGDGWVDLDDPDCQGQGGAEAPGGFYGSECNDDTDNDGDGLVDSMDPNCDDAYDDDEAAAGCEDGLDNDGDGWIDGDDPDCYYWGGTSEVGLDVGGWECADGDDNDGDGLIDGNDPDCLDAEHPTEAAPDPSCSDTEDNDGDGWIDGDDPDCADIGGAEDPGSLYGSECNDGTDNDGDGDIDADDAQCADAYDDQEQAIGCEDGTDNDGDGWTDQDDPDCYHFGADDELGLVISEQCGDGTDNDGDGFIDGLDPECSDAEDDDESQ